MTSNTTSERLHASILWFAVIAAILSSFIAHFMWTMSPNFLGALAIAAVPATILSSVLFWWLFIVRPQHVSIVRGTLAGIVSIISALLLMWLFVWPYLAITSGASGWRDILILPAELLILGLFTMLFVSSTPLGWIFFLIGGSVGALLASYLRRSVLLKANIDSQVF